MLLFDRQSASDYRYVAQSLGELDLCRQWFRMFPSNICEVSNEAKTLNRKVYFSVIMDSCYQEQNIRSTSGP